MLGLQYFSITALWRPVELVIAIAIVAVYIILTGPKRSMFPDSAPVSFGKKALFIGGVAIYYFAQGGPLNLLGHLMFSAHMTAMTLAYLIAPPLLLLGIPGWLIRPLLAKRGAMKIVRVLTHPLAAVLTFNILFSFYHMPYIHDYVMTNFGVHRLFFTALLIAALMMWWPIIEPVPETSQLGELKKMAFIFANGVLITPACALIIFAENPLFATYNDPQMWATAMGYCLPANSAALLLDQFQGPEFFSVFGAREDQQLGGVIMKIMQEITYGAALAYTFFSWYTRERANDKLEPNPIA